MDYMPFNSVSNDRVYRAEDWAWYFSTFISNGVFAKPTTGLQVTFDSAMNVNVEPGFGFINGYAFRNSAQTSFTIATPHATLKRIDRVVLRWDINQRLMLLAVKQGTPSASPVAPALTRTSSIYELALGDILVRAGVTALSQSVITDRRGNKNLCGFVTGVVDQIDWDALTVQLTTYMDEFKDGLEAWVDNLHDILDTQAATHLMRLIQDVERKFDKKIGSGAGAANSLVYKEEITEITDSMWANIKAGTFYGVHVGMHYTAPSGRSYYFADADYFYRHTIFYDGAWRDINFHHMLVIEDEINHEAKMSSASNTQGGYAYSSLKTTVDGYLGELETDFGASHILRTYVNMPLYQPSKTLIPHINISTKSFLLNTAMIYGSHPLRTPPYPSGTSASQSFYQSNRSRQLSLFRALPDAIIAPYGGEDNSNYWLDDITSTTTFGYINRCVPASRNLKDAIGIRRAFIIGGYSGNLSVAGDSLTGYANA